MAPLKDDQIPPVVALGRRIAEESKVQPTIQPGGVAASLGAVQAGE
jgi:hypothetical protein